MNDLYDTISEQLPEGIRNKLSILVMPYYDWELPEVIISDGKGRDWAFFLDEHGKIPEVIIARLCLEA